MIFYHFAHAVCNAFVHIAYRYKVEGVENLPTDQGFILCSNHRSYIDPIFLGLKVKAPLVFMAKEELFRNRLFSWLIRKLGAFPVARGKGDTGALDKAIEFVEEGKALVLFPEGTRSKTGEMLKLKSGVVVVAAQSRGLIVPTAIVFEGKLRFRRKVTVRYGAPLHCEELGLDGMDRQSLRHARELLTDKMKDLLEA